MAFQPFLLCAFIVFDLCRSISLHLIITVLQQDSSTLDHLTHFLRKFERNILEIFYLYISLEHLPPALPAHYLAKGLRRSYFDFQRSVGDQNSQQQVTTKMSPTLASIEKFPSKSEIITQLVSSINSVAPGKGSLLSSLTVPEIVFCCVQPTCSVSSPKRDHKKYIFFMVKLVFKIWCWESLK